MVDASSVELMSESRSDAMDKVKRDTILRKGRKRKKKREPDDYRTNTPKNAKKHARACEILQLYRDGLSEREIAQELGIGKSTVHQYIDVIIRQLRNKYGQ